MRIFMCVYVTTHHIAVALSSPVHSLTHIPTLSFFLWHTHIRTLESISSVEISSESSHRSVSTDLLVQNLLDQRYSRLAHSPAHIPTPIHTHSEWN